MHKSSIPGFQLHTHLLVILPFLGVTPGHLDSVSQRNFEFLF